MGAGATPSADASRLPRASSLLRATRFALMSAELHKCKLGASSHCGTPVVLKAQGHPHLGKEREDTRAPAHTSVAVREHTRVHTELPFGDVPRVARVCSGRKIPLPQFLQQNRFCFSLSGSGVTSGLQK